MDYNPTVEQIDLYDEISAAFDQVKTSNFFQLKKIWEENYERVLSLEAVPGLYWHLIAKKEYFKKLCEQGKMEDYQAARVRCQENLLRRV